MPGILRNQVREIRRCHAVAVVGFGLMIAATRQGIGHDDGRDDGDTGSNEAAQRCGA